MKQDVTVHIVDDDEAMRKSLGLLMKSIDMDSTSYASAEEFIENFIPTQGACILMDVRMPGLSGLELQEYLRQNEIHTPVIIMTGHGDIRTAVKAMKAGAIDFVEKPFDHELLVDAINNCVIASTNQTSTKERHTFVNKLNLLTSRELEVFDRLVNGKINKAIAAELNLSVRTVEAHRANIMSKLNAHSLSDLVKMSIYASLENTNE